MAARGRCRERADAISSSPGGVSEREVAAENPTSVRKT